MPSLRLILTLSLCAAMPAIAQTEARSEAALVKILEADDRNPNNYDPDEDGIIDRAHLRLLDTVVRNTSAPNHAVIAAIWLQNYTQILSDLPGGNQCTLLEIIFGLTCEDFARYGAGQLTIAEPAGIDRLAGLLAQVGFGFDRDAYNYTAGVWLAADGDLDGDGADNVTEFGSVCGAFDAFVVAAQDAAQNPATLPCCANCPMEFTQQPQGARKYVGESHALSVQVANAQGAVTYQWRRNNQPVGGNSPTYTIGSVQLSSAGAYQCIATDSRGSVTSATAQLDVAPPLEIAQQPMAARLYFDESHTFTIGVSGGFQPLTYQWSRNGAIIGTDAGSFSIGAAALEDAGEYRCRVSDGRSIVNSQAAHLAVAPPLRLVSQPQGATLQTGASHSLVVEAEGGLGARTYQWFRGETPLQADAPELTLTSLRLADAGEYFCRVSDERTALDSDRVTLNVYEPLHFVAQPLSAVVLAGERHVLSVNVAGGLGARTYDWLKDGQSLGIDSTQLTFDAIAAEDSGEYQCRVTDSTGSVLSGTAELMVSQSILLTEHPLGAVRYAGSSHTFRVRVSGGVGALRYEWRKDGEPLSAAAVNGPELTLSGLVVADSGQYRCAVSDDNETILSQPAELIVGERLTIAQQPQDLRLLLGIPAELQVRAGGGAGPLTYAWTRDGAPLEFNGPDLPIAAESEEESGRYACTVRDGLSAIQTRAAKVEILPRLAIVQQPSNVTLELGARLLLQVVAEGGIGPLTYRWTRNGAPIGANSSRIEFARAAIEEAGIYQCHITDGIDNVQTFPIIVRVRTGNPAGLTISPVEGLDFGFVELEEAASQTFQIHNGTGSLKTGTIEVLGRGFTLPEGPNFQLGDGESIEVPIHFMPSAKEAFSGVVEVRVGTVTLHLPLQGAGVSSGGLSCGSGGPGASSRGDLALLMLLVPVLLAWTARTRGPAA